MVVSCCAYGCTARSVAGGSRSFHRFPRNAEMREKWIKATRRKDFHPGTHTYICSDHFVEEAYDESKTSGFCSRRYLKSDAVPSVFAFPPKKVKTQKPPLNQICPQSTADVENTIATDYIDVNSRPTSSSLKSIKAPTIRYILYHVAKDTDSFLTDIPKEQSTADGENTTASVVNSKPTSSSLKSIKAPTIQFIRYRVAKDMDSLTDIQKEQSTADGENTKASVDVENTVGTDYIDVNSTSTSSSLKSITAPKLRYIGDRVAKDMDSSTDIKKGQSTADGENTIASVVNSKSTSSSLKSIKAPIQFIRYGVAKDTDSLTDIQKEQSTADSENIKASVDVESRIATDYIDVNSTSTSSSLKSITAPKLRYVGDCFAKKTDSLTDIKTKLDFVLSAYRLQQKRMKTLTQKCRRLNKRYTFVKNALDELQYKFDRKTAFYRRFTSSGQSYDPAG